MAKAKTESKGSAKDIIMGLIPKGQTDEQIIKAVLVKFPGSAVATEGGKHMAKYRKLALDNEAIDASMAAVGSKAHKEWAEENPAAARTKKCPHFAHWKARDVAAKAKAAEAKAAAKVKKAA